MPQNLTQMSKEELQKKSDYHTKRGRRWELALFGGAALMAISLYDPSSPKYQPYETAQKALTYFQNQRDSLTELTDSGYTIPQEELSSLFSTTQKQIENAEKRIEEIKTRKEYEAYQNNLDKSSKLMWGEFSIGGLLALLSGIFVWRHSRKSSKYEMEQIRRI